MTPNDYSSYSLAELRQALSTVDALKYPDNKAALEAELERRVASGEVEREERAQTQREHEKEQSHRRFARSARPWIGLYLMGAPVMLIGLGFQDLSDAGLITYLVLAFAVIYSCLAALAGYGLWKQKDWSRRLAIGVFALQVINIRSGFLIYSVTSAIAVFFHVTPTAGYFGVAGNLTTGGMQFFLGDLGIPLTIGVNLFAVFMIWLLVKARQPLDGEEAGVNTRPEGWSD